MDFAMLHDAKKGTASFGRKRGLRQKIPTPVQRINPFPARAHDATPLFFFLLTLTTCMLCQCVAS